MRKVVITMSKTTFEKLGIPYEERVAEVNETAYELLDDIENLWLKKHKPKNSGSFMEQLQFRTQARMMAEGIVLADVVMQFH